MSASFLGAVRLPRPQASPRAPDAPPRQPDALACPRSSVVCGSRSHMSHQPTSNAAPRAEEPKAAPRPSVRAPSPLIETRSVCKNYGAFRALEDVSIAVRQGEFVSIVGPNGAGKTTLVNLLTGLLVPTKGEVYFKGRNIAGVGPVTLATQGVARTFQLVQIFPELTVAETIAAAVVTRQGKRWRLFSPLLQDVEIATRVAEIAGMFGLSSRLATLSRLLSQGEKKLLDVASAFALDPKLILLDEPTSGVSTAEKHAVMKTLVGAARTAGVKAIVLVEHDMDLVASYSHRIVALSEGKVLADLPPDAFFADPVIIETVVGKRRGDSC